MCHIISRLLLQSTGESKQLISELRSSFPLSIWVLEHTEDLGQLVDSVVADTASQEGFFPFLLCLARRAQPFLSHVVPAQVIHTFLTTRLDYSNALRVRLHLEAIWQLNLVCIIQPPVY